MAKKQAQDPKLNDGAKRLNALGYSQKQIADECNVGQAIVSKWSRGTALPRSKIRVRLKSVFNIPISAWDSKSAVRYREQTTKAKATPAKPELASVLLDQLPADRDADKDIEIPEGTTIESCDSLIRELDEACIDPEASAATIGRLIMQKVAVLRLRAKIEFDSIRIKDLMIREHPDMAKLLEGICSVLVKYPDACAELKQWLNSEGGQY